MTLSLPSDDKSPLRTIHVLVCSANLGNQQPDEDSLASWIPYDGAVKEVVVEVPRYPVVPHHDGMHHHIDGRTQSILQHQAFDIIVIGMQEATFEVDTLPTGTGFASMSGASLFASQAYKAQKAVEGLTRAKDHLKSSRSDESLITATAIKKSFRWFLGGNTSQRLTREDSTSILQNTSVKKMHSSRRSSSKNDHPSRSSRRGRPMTTDRTGSVINVSARSSHHAPSTNGGIDVSERYAVDGSSGNAALQSDTKILHALLQSQLPSYKHAISYQRGQMRMMLFHNDKNDVSLEVISIKAQNTGKGGLANKGGIVAEVLVNGTTRLSFFTAHLEAHEGINKYDMRCSSVAEIFRGTTSKTTTCKSDAALASHFTFAMGDLNFRTRLPRYEPGSESHIAATHDLVQEKEWERLYSCDELTHALQNNDCFSGFSTAMCAFPPTFKVERKHGYTYNPKRSPSYTDRILFTTGHCLRNHLKMLAYEPIDEFTSSDHKPIRGAFELTLNPRIKWRPTIVKSYSMRQSFRTKSGVKPESVDKRDFLHLFVSSLHVQIDEAQYRKNHDVRTPNLFVCFVSTPGEALKQDVGRWARLKGYAGTLYRVSKKLGRSQGLDGWPQTRRRKHSFDAHWDEVVHFKVHTHDKKGIPIDLSGAIIHIAVLDGYSHNLVGIFPLNLAFLLTHSRKGTALKKTEDILERTKSSSSRWSLLGHFAAKSRRRNSQEDRSFKLQQVERSYSIGTGPKPSDSMMGDDSVANIVSASHSTELMGQPRDRIMKNNDEHHEDDVMTRGPSAQLLRRTTHRWRRSRKPSGTSSLDSTEVCSMNVNQPIRKYGVTVGHIQFTIDSWWLNDEAATKRASGGSGPSEMVHEEAQ